MNCIVYNASHRSYVKDPKLSEKNHIAPHWEIHKDIATQPKYRTELYHHARYLPRANNTHFPYRGLPSHAIHFQKALFELILNYN